MGWIKDACFVYLLLPDDYREKRLQTEIDWSKHELLEETGNSSLKETDDQISLLDELEKQIARQTH